ncbi:lipopolysaccharide biosynthesis protein [Allobranchiibius huperziae]|uniref:O-antigen/teichoic acid export membrane protein n=1 Tax=Allobranchiibius huperziae TaxID=1874116 RepID=A0A853DDL4_9MICO|nr:lipopolysaccharide biosynthesis protein [Allobranchiibius huperziae]NYJ75666.1 O-antigen/teichoic acid export membrane protein [Allobranchiibius huperziae]
MTAAATDAPAVDATATHGLFGRGLLYVLAWSGQLLISTLVSPFLTHLLPRSDFGVLSAAIALYQLVAVLATFGLDQALEMQRVEDGADDRRGRGLLATGIVFAFVVITAFLVLSPLWGPALGFTGSRHMVYVALAWTAPGAAVQMVLALLQAEDRLARFMTVSVVSTVSGQFIGLALVLGVHRSAQMYGLGIVTAQWAALVLGVIWTRPRWRGIADLATTRIALRLGIPLVFAGLSDFILTAGDRFIIQRALGPGEVARYQVAFVIGNAVTLILLFTNRAWLPRFKSILDVEERWRVIGASRDGLYWLLGWALLAVTVAAPPLLRVFVTPSYHPAPLARIVFLVGLSSLPVAAGAASSRMLITVRRSAPIAWSAGIAVVAKLVVTFALLSSLHLEAAAIGTLAGLSAQTLWLRRSVVALHGRSPSSRTSLGFLVAMMLLSGGSTYLPQSTWWNVGRLVFGMLCVVPLLMSLRTLQGRSSDPDHPAVPATSGGGSDTRWTRGGTLMARLQVRMPRSAPRGTGAVGPPVARSAAGPYAPPHEPGQATRTPGTSLRARWARWTPWTPPASSSGGGLSVTSYVDIAIVTLGAVAVVLAARVLGVHDLGSGGTWLLLQLVPGLAVCIWVEGLRPSSLVLFSWVGSATVVTGVGMGMALSAQWHPGGAYAVVGGASVISLAAFVVRHRDVDWLLWSVRPLTSRDALWTGWPAVVGVLISLLSAQPHHSGPVRGGLTALVLPTWFLGLALIVTAFVAAVTRRVRPWVSVISAAVVVIASQALVYALPALPTAARHVGVIRYVLTYHQVRPSTDIYQAWSGLFTGQAWLISASGIHDPFTVATWWPVFAMGMEALAVRVLAGRILSPRRAWIAGGIFALGNTLNTVYFAPQVLAFAPGLSIVALLLAPPEGESQRRARLRVLAAVPVACAIVVQHQITPFIVTAALGVLVVTRAIKPWWSPLIVLVPALAWTVANLGILRAYVEPGEVGNVIANIAPPTHPPSAVGEPLVTQATFLLPASALFVIGFVALLMFVRTRDRVAWTLAIAAASPVTLSLGTNYGGEGIFRITLFALPWLAILALRKVPGRHLGVGRWLARARLGTPVVALAATGMLAIAVVGQTGMDWARVISPGAVRADYIFETQALAGSLVLDLGTQNASPALQAARYQDVIYTSRDLEAKPGTTGYPTTAGAKYDPVTDLRQVTAEFAKQPATAHYLFVSDQIGAYDERYGNQSYADFVRLRAAVRASTQWSIVVRTPDAELYRLVSGGKPR